MSDTSLSAFSKLDLTAALTVGGNARSALLTVYKRYGRVRIAADGATDAAARLEQLLAEQLELVVATRLTKPVSGHAVGTTAGDPLAALQAVRELSAANHRR